MRERNRERERERERERDGEGVVRSEGVCLIVLNSTLLTNQKIIFCFYFCEQELLFFLQISMILYVSKNSLLVR